MPHRSEPSRDALPRRPGAVELGLPELGPQRGVSPAEKLDFDRDGQVLLRQVATPQEVAAYRAVIADAVSAVPPHKASGEEGDVYARAFSQHINLWAFDNRAACFSLAPRFARIAAELLGVDSVRVYHDQALIKEAGGGRTPWHQDMHYWPLDDSRMVTMWMPLVDVTPEMGELEFVAGSHHLGRLSDIPISEASDEVFARFLSTRELGPRKHTGRMLAGDASFHASWTLHAAAPNQTRVPREVMTVIWFADGAKVTPPENAGQEADLKTWLRGCQPGEPAVGPLNPLVFDRHS